MAQSVRPNQLALRAFNPVAHLQALAKCIGLLLPAPSLQVAVVFADHQRTVLLAGAYALFS